VSEHAIRYLYDSIDNDDRPSKRDITRMQKWHGTRGRTGDKFELLLLLFSSNRILMRYTYICV